MAVWLEAAYSTKDASRYDYVTTLDYEGTTDKEEPLPSASDIKQNVAFLIDGKYILNESNESSDKTVTVKGDGTAIANVYLDRAEFTVDLRCSAKGESGKKITSPRTRSRRITARTSPTNGMRRRRR